MSILNKQCIECEDYRGKIGIDKYPKYNVFYTRWWPWYTVKTGGTFRGLFSVVLL
jgi:hypothetical protein